MSSPGPAKPEPLHNFKLPPWATIRKNNHLRRLVMSESFLLQQSPTQYNVATGINLPLRRQQKSPLSNPARARKEGDSIEVESSNTPEDATGNHSVSANSKKNLNIIIKSSHLKAKSLNPSSLTENGHKPLVLPSSDCMIENVENKSKLTVTRGPRLLLAKNYIRQHCKDLPKEKESSNSSSNSSTLNGNGNTSLMLPSSDCMIEKSENKSNLTVHRGPRLLVAKNYIRHHCKDLAKEKESLKDLAKENEKPDELPYVPPKTKDSAEDEVEDIFLKSWNLRPRKLSLKKQSCENAGPSDANGETLENENGSPFLKVSRSKREGKAPQQKRKQKTRLVVPEVSVQLLQGELVLKKQPCAKAGPSNADGEKLENENESPLPKFNGSKREGKAPQQKKKKKKKAGPVAPEFSIQLPQCDINDDFLFMTGAYPSRKLKKRPKDVQRTLDNLFPGMLLGTITPESYNVAEPCLKDR